MEASIAKQRSALIREYESIAGKEGIKKARRNYHSRRRPIQCGLTIHPGNDCAYSCLYCYIRDMGYKFQKPKPCPLTSSQLVLSLLYNRNFIPGRSGTYLAIGSIVEPFQPELKSLTISYIAELAKLSNPIQFSTKSHLASAEARMISSSCSWVSPLITILTLNESKARILEPLVPTPRERLDTIKNLAKEGLRPFLFLRPVLPGIVTLEEYVDLINEAINHGAKGIVLGNFRVTERIVDALMRKKLDVSEIVQRSRIIDGRQRAIYVSDIQEKIERLLSPHIKTYRRSCCASSYCAGLERCTHKTECDHTGS